MARAIWSGSVSFGLVSIPVKLYNAVSRKNVSFNQIDSRSGARIRYRKVSDADGDDVPSEAIVKGYQLSSGDYVLIGDDELSALDPEASRTVEIEQFVDLSEIDPLFYDAAYYAAPDKAARKPYALLLRAMEEQNRVAIARFVMRSKQYLCALRPDNGVLVLSTMVYADEVNDPAELTELDEMDDVEVSDRELLMARQLIDSLTEDFEPARFEDTYRLRVLDLIERKASGDLEVVAPPAPAAEEKLVDLMAALEESVKEAKQARTRHPTSKPSDSKKAAKAEKAPAAAKRRSA
ncbi:MAG TPA: Ku protein [Acidimicrobiales bacterium]|jgi:DNA end-binding protein Ku